VGLTIAEYFSQVENPGMELCIILDRRTQKVCRNDRTQGIGEFGDHIEMSGAE
jgi:hypothetical protein